MNHRTITAYAACVVAAAGLMLGGCKDSEEAAAPPQTSGSVSTLASSSTPATSTGSTSEPPEEIPHSCDVDPNSEAVHAAVDVANSDYPNPHGGWVYEGVSNWNPCGNLTYAKLVQAEQGDAQFGTMLLFFHKGDYLGFDSIYPQQSLEEVPDANSESIRVTYKDWGALAEAGAPAAEAPNYTAEVVYVWDEDADIVAHEGQIPNQHLEPLYSP